MAGSILAIRTALADNLSPTNAPTSVDVPAVTNAVPATPGQPYAIIPVRNAFGVHPPPPQVEPTVEAPPPIEKLNVSLTGVRNYNGKKEAYFVVQPKDPKNGPDYITITEGETAPSGYDFKVLSIDEDEPTVKVKNTGEEVVMNLKDNGYKGGPQGNGLVPAGVPGVFPGGGPPRVVPTANPPTVGGAGGGGGPTIIGRGGQVYGGGDLGGQAQGLGLNPTANVSPNNLLINGNANGVGTGINATYPTQIPTRTTTAGPGSNPSTGGGPRNPRANPLPPPAPGE